MGVSKGLTFWKEAFASKVFSLKIDVFIVGIYGREDNDVHLIFYYILTAVYFHIPSERFFSQIRLPINSSLPFTLNTLYRY